MSERTGRASGSLDPVIAYESPSGYFILAPQQIGEGIALARKIYEERYRPQKWEWREFGANGLHEVDWLQGKLVEQELRRNNQMLEVHGERREIARKAVAESLRSRMVSRDTSEFEREFIRYYLELREDSKRDKYREALKQHNYYLWSREMETSTKVEDRMKPEAGDLWRSEAQQRD